MNKAQNVFGNLALKPVAEHEKPVFRVIDSSKNKRSVYEELADQVFAHSSSKAFGNEQTAKAYAMSGRSFFKTSKERRFAYIACALATVAVFYFSFFAFV